MSTSSKKWYRCKSCSKHLTRWGTSYSGKKRWYCVSCKTIRVASSSKVLNPFNLVRKYILFGYTYDILTEESGYSVRQLVRIVHKYLSQEPPVCILPKLPTSETFLLVDGMWLKRWCVMLAYRRSKDLTILHISLAGKESWYSVARDLKHIRDMHFKFNGIVSDGGTGIVSAIKEVFPYTTHQICMAHIHRDAIRGLGKRPIDPRIRTLRKLADHIWLIESKEALEWWEGKRDEWINQNQKYLREYRQDTIGKWWYIHKGSRKAVRILKKIPDTSFKFLDKPLMPKTTNELEAQFGHFGKRWLIHRGLKTERWDNFMKWFVYFYNMHQLEKQKPRVN